MEEGVFNTWTIDVEGGKKRGPNLSLHSGGPLRGVGRRKRKRYVDCLPSINK